MCPLWAILGRSWCLLGRPAVSLGASWGHLGAILSDLEWSWGPLGAMLCQSGRPKTLVFLGFFNVFCKSDISKKNSNVWPSWSGLGASWVALGPSWDRLGAVLGRLWAVLGIFGTLLGPHRRHGCDLQSAGALVWGGSPPRAY